MENGRDETFIVLDVSKIGFQLKLEKNNASTSISQCVGLETFQALTKQTEGCINDDIMEEDDFVAKPENNGKNTSDNDNNANSRPVVNMNGYNTDSDEDGFEVDYEDRIVCFEKNAENSAKDACIDDKCSSDNFLLQNKLRQKVMFFSRLSKDEKCQPGHIILNCDESKGSTSRSDFRFDIHPVVTQDPSMENPLEENNDRIHQTSESTSEKKTIISSQKVPNGGWFQVDSQCLDNNSNKSNRDFLHQQIHLDDLGELRFPSLHKDLQMECISKTTIDGKYFGIESGWVSDLHDLVHSEASLSEPDEGMTSRKNSLVQNDYEESSFSGSGILSASLLCSGHLQYSGSISMLSDRSTTSTGSFAFPILQREWNSSPVRMAEADSRRRRRNRNWKLGLLCCRF